ncbi:uncharacterized protein Hap1MRO34_025992 [Clarias gariepinus]
MEKTTMDASKVILFYVPIVTRPGIDIEAALQKLSGLEDKYVALVVLHHTFDRESVVPDSSRIVNREKTITVDCLFHEDEGLLKCQRNDDAIKKVADWLRDVKYHDVQHFEKRKMKKARGDTFEIKKKRLDERNEGYLIKEWLLHQLYAASNVH